MGLDFAIDELYAAGWLPLHSQGCEHTPEGRAYPSVRRAEQEFEAVGRRLRVRYMPKFDCHRAEWCEVGGPNEGAVVGQTPEEAAVYALAHLRRQSVPAGA